jgi:hypothetical protein
MDKKGPGGVLRLRNLVSGQEPYSRTTMPIAKTMSAAAIHQQHGMCAQVLGWLIGHGALHPDDKDAETPLFMPPASAGIGGRAVEGTRLEHRQRLAPRGLATIPRPMMKTNTAAAVI